MTLLRNSRITPGIQWNPDLRGGRYVTNRGRTIVSAKDVKKQINDYIASEVERVRGLTSKLQTGEITVAEFQLALRDAIANTNIAGAALAKGGWAQMTPSDYGKAGAAIKKQYGGIKAWGKRGLREFMTDLESGKQKMDGSFVNRALQYVKSGNHTYEDVRRGEVKEAGLTQERSVRHKSDSCPGCLAATAAGWVAIGTLPLPGERDCFSNCGCTMDYRQSKSKL